MEFLFDLSLVSLIILAVFVVFMRKLRGATIMFGVFSAFASLVYLLLAAPDVALAEAIIGCTISTIIFLVSLRKYHIYKVCILPSDKRLEAVILSIIDRQAAKKEIEPHYIYKTSQEEMESMYYDLGFLINENEITLFGEEHNYVISEVMKEIKNFFPYANINLKTPNYDEI